MQVVTGAFAAHLAADTTLAKIWKVTRRDGVILGFTEATRDITFGGIVYAPALGMSASAIESSADAAVDNIELDVIVDSALIKEVDIAAGKWDHASIEIYEVNYMDLTMGGRLVFKGWTGVVSTKGPLASVEGRSLSQAMQQRTGDMTSIICRYDNGDANCKFVQAPVTSTVGSSADRGSFIDNTRTEATGWFDYALLHWLPGAANFGFDTEVKTYVNAAGVKTFTLASVMFFPIIAGDGYSVAAGDDKTFATCRDKFANAINFGGEPWLVGNDFLVRPA